MKITGANTVVHLRGSDRGLSLCAYSDTDLEVPADIVANSEDINLGRRDAQYVRLSLTSVLKL